MDLELAGKTAIVTGGSRGIGKAVARELAAEGVDVAVVARSAEALAQSAAELAEATGRRIVPIVADTGSDESVKAMVEQAASALGQLDILVNCAGIAPVRESALDGTDEDWRHSIDVNFLSVGFNSLLYAIFSLGLNVAVGWAGLLDLGYIAFVGFGAYGYAVLSSTATGSAASRSGSIATACAP